MKTKILWETRLIALLTANERCEHENLTTFRNELRMAYDEFSDKLVEYIEGDNYVEEKLHSLIYIRVELHALQREQCYEAKKKCAYTFMPRQDSGIDRIGNRVMQVTQPESFF